MLPHCAPLPLVVLLAIVHAPQAALWLLLPLLPLPPWIHTPSCPATDATATAAITALHVCPLATYAATAALELHILLLPLWFVCDYLALTSLPFVTQYCKSIISNLIVIFACLCIWYQLQIAWLWSVRGSGCGNIGVNNVGLYLEGRWCHFWWWSWLWAEWWNGTCIYVRSTSDYPKFPSARSNLFLSWFLLREGLI